MNKKKKGFYYIENTINEWNRSHSAYFETLEEAKEAIKHFSDWWRGDGTGRIYFQEFGTKQKTITGCFYEDGKVVERDYQIVHGIAPEFVCRAEGLDENGNVIFSDKEY